MAVDLKGRHLKTLLDYSEEEIYQILQKAEELKLRTLSGESTAVLPGRTLAMIFEKPSTRTRVSFEIAMYQLGGHALYLSSNDLQLGRGETIADTSRVISRYASCIMARVFSHNSIEELAANSKVPVINGLSDFTHPCQILADLLTINEKFGGLTGLRLAYVGDGNNVCNSLMFGCAKVGVDITVVSPPGFEPAKDVIEKTNEICQLSGSELEITDSPSAISGADVIYTDVWTSMGQEKEADERLKKFKKYQLNEKMMKSVEPHAIVMHCLPAHRGEEITDAVVDGPHSVVFDQAENRLHAQKAVLALLVR